MLEVLSLLISGEATARAEKAMHRRIAQARLPKRKTLEEYKFDFPRKIPKQKVLRLFDCEFVANMAAPFSSEAPVRGKSHLLTRVGLSRLREGNQSPL